MVQQSGPTSTKNNYHNNRIECYRWIMQESKRVLFVDDDASILSSFKRALRNSFDVHTAEGAQEALTMMEEMVFPVVVSDLKMAKMDGIHLLKLIKKKHPNSTRVLLTGHADLNSAISAVNEGEIFRFLQKPCELTLLKRVLKDAIHQHRLVVTEQHLIQTHRKLADAYLDVKLLSDQQAKLIATASHDLRSPLTSIAGFVQLISKDLNKIASNEEKRIKRINDNLSIINEESERMLRLINDLLDKAKPGTNRKEWSTEKVNLSELIDKAQRSLLGKLNKKPKIDLQFTGPENDLTINASYDRLMQVFVNLLDNAIKFTSEGHIQTRLTTDNDSNILITIEDSGCGIEPERLDHIFDRYHSTDTENKVSGLGLPICKQIIEHYKGTIDVTSEQGVGTTFTICLPTTDAVG